MTLKIGINGFGRIGRLVAERTGSRSEYHSRLNWRGKSSRARMLPDLKGKTKPLS